VDQKKIDLDIIKTPRFLSVLIISIILISASIFIVSPQFKTEKALKAVPRANVLITYVCTTIQFKGSDSQGDIIRFSWNFQDGNISNETNPSHSYGNPGWYDVVLTVTDKNNRNSKSSLQIGVQHINGSDTKTHGRIWNLRGTAGPYPATVLTGPNIHNPTIICDVKIYNVVGIIEIRIEAFSANNTNSETLLLNDENLKNEDYSIRIEYNETNLPDWLGQGDSYIQLYISIKQGTWNSAEFGINATFDLDLNQSNEKSSSNME